ncbi:MAG: caspase family protein [Desulfobacteraceae bacterium]
MKQLNILLGAVFFLFAANSVFAQQKPEIFPQTGHGKISTITSLAVSPDGNFLASADSNLMMRNIKIWDWKNGREFRTIPLDDSSLYYHLMFSSDSKKILVMGSGSINIFDLVSGKEIKHLDLKGISFSELSYPDKILNEHSISGFVSPFRFPAGASKYLPDKKFYYRFTLEDYSFNFYRAADNKKVLSIPVLKDDFSIQIASDFSNYSNDLVPNWVNNAVLSPDFKYLFIGGKWKEEQHPVISVYELNTGRKINELGKVAATGTSLLSKPFDRYLLNYDFSDKSHIVVWDTKSSGKPVFFLKKGKDKLGDDYNDFKDKHIIKGEDGLITLSKETESVDGQYEAKTEPGTDTIILYDKKSKKELARFISFTDREWIVITPEGYFNASPGGAKHLNVRIGLKVYPIDNFFEKYFDPVYVEFALKGKKITPEEDIRDGILTPPEVSIVSPDPDDIFKKDTIKVSVVAKDTGGGIDEIRLFHNGKVINDKSRALKYSSQKKQAAKAFKVTLVEGINSFRAEAFTKDRTRADSKELFVRFSGSTKDSVLHVFSVGINKYRNSALNLNYAQSDAGGISSFFREKGAILFSKTEINEIYNEEATRENIVKKLENLGKTKPQDAVVIYLAGHGESYGDSWYFIPHELVYPEREEDVKSKALSSEMLSELIKKITAQKILVIVDACKSGAVLTAFRGFEDRKALAMLSRSTGVHVIAASTKDQYASEVKELGHGVFTFTLLKGLEGGASGNSKTVTVRKLMGYIEENLPDFTSKYKNEVQFPVIVSKGMDFPLVISE